MAAEEDTRDIAIAARQAIHDHCGECERRYAAICGKITALVDSVTGGHALLHKRLNAIEATANSRWWRALVGIILFMASVLLALIALIWRQHLEGS